ncbi:MAG: YceI family protein [Bacteroidetes bacterium]|nr:YceI family protein [Bacteroidota bacterium]
MKALTTIISIVVGAIVMPSLGQITRPDPVRFVLEKGSSIWIEGTSTISRFKCESAYVQGYGILYNEQDPSADLGIEAEIAAPVKLFDCNLAAMNADFWDALKSDQFPLIEYWVNDISIDSVSTTVSGTYAVRSSGRITIAGVKKRIEMEFVGRQIGPERFKLEGKTEMFMSDFDIKPPTALFGLVRAQNRITVHFNLITTTQSIKARIKEIR